MSLITIAIIGVILIFVIGMGIYFAHEYRSDLNEIRDIQKHRANKEALLLDYYRVVNRMGSEYNPQYFRRVQKWSAEDESQIYEKGYLFAEKWMDDLRYAGIDVYVRLHGFRLPPEPNRITSSVLYNVYNSRSVHNFINGITKINFAAIDLKMVGVMIPVVIGLALGAFYFLGMK